MSVYRLVQLALAGSMLVIAASSVDAVKPMPLTCGDTGNFSADRHHAIVRQYIDALNQGTPEAAGPLFASDAVLHIGNDALPVGQWLANLKAGTDKFTPVTVIGEMFDGSNSIAVQLLEKGSTDETTNIWVVEVGGGCILGVHEF